MKGFEAGMAWKTAFGPRIASGASEFAGATLGRAAGNRQFAGIRGGLACPLAGVER